MASPLELHHPPAFFVSGPSPFAKLIFFVALSIALMAVDSRMQYLNKIRTGFISVTSPLQAIANAPSELYQSLARQLVTRAELIKKNDRLTKQAMQNSMILQRFKSLEIENSRLRNLLVAAQTSILPSKLGEIVHMGRDPFVHKVTVNLGSHHKIVPGQAVIDDKGVIGQVTNVYSNSSEVTLITDKSLSIPIQIERNGLRAVAFGRGRDYTLDLPYLPANVDILKDDILITSGIDGVYPEGLVVAKIASITHQQDSPFANIVAVPVAGVMNHRQLLLLNLPQKIEVDEKVNRVIPPANIKTKDLMPIGITTNQLSPVLTKPALANTVARTVIDNPSQQSAIAKLATVKPAIIQSAITTTLAAEPASKPAVRSSVRSAPKPANIVEPAHAPG